MIKPVQLLRYILISIFLSSTAFAGDSNGYQLNTVTLQLKSEQWLATNTASVGVNVNAALTDQGVEKIQNSIMQKLNQIAKADWHVTSFNRSQDRSGLESVQIRAEARLNRADLTGLRDRAKNVSKQGETFSIDNVDFTPSDEEIRAANAALRNDIYQQAKREIDVLNAVYANNSQRYYLHSINFMQTPIVMPMAMAAVAKNNAPSLNVGNKAELTATVVLAEIPDFPTNLPRAR